MEVRRKDSRSLLRWSLAGLFAASLWLGALFGGRHAGFDRGYAEGFDAIQKDGFAAGRVEGIRQTAELYYRQGLYECAYDVSHLLDDPYAERSAIEPGEVPRYASFDDLIHEIVTNVDPESWPEFGGTGSNSIRGFPTNLTLVVSAQAVHHAEIAILLESKQDYLAWKRSQQKP